MQPKTTILMYCRNNANRLEQSVHAVLDGTGEDVELVALDDASEDETAGTLAELSLIWPDRMRVVSHMDPLGLAASISDGMRCARGVYATIIRPQDLVNMEEVAKLVAVAEESGADIVAGAFDFDFGGRVPEPGEIASLANAMEPERHDCVAPEIARDVFSKHKAGYGLEGKLFDVTLLKHASSALTLKNLPQAQDEAVMMICALKADKMVCVPEAVTMRHSVADSTKPVTLADVVSVASARATAEALMSWIARSGNWEEQADVWFDLALSLTKRSLDALAKVANPADWPHAAEIVLSAWGGSLTGAALLSYGDEQAEQLLLRLSCSKDFAIQSRRPRTIGCLVNNQAELAELPAVLQELSSKGVQVHLIAADDLALDEDVAVAGTVSTTDPLKHARDLDEVLRTNVIDTLITFDVPEGQERLVRHATDLLVARARGIATATVFAKPMAKLSSWLGVTLLASLSAVSVFEEDVPGTSLAKALGSRTCKASSMVSQLTLGTLHDSYAEAKHDAGMLIAAAHAERRAVKVAADQQAEAHRREVENLNEEMRDQKARLERELDEVQAELEDTRASRFNFGRPKRK